MSHFRLQNVYCNKKCVRVFIHITKKLDNIPSVKTCEILKYNLNIVRILNPNTPNILKSSQNLRVF